MGQGLADRILKNDPRIGMGPRESDLRKEGTQTRLYSRVDHYHEQLKFHLLGPYMRECRNHNPTKGAGGRAFDCLPACRLRNAPWRGREVNLHTRKWRAHSAQSALGKARVFRCSWREVLSSQVNTLQWKRRERGRQGNAAAQERQATWWTQERHCLRHVALRYLTQFCFS